jgi:flagellar hook-length control protein FliK
MVAEMERPAPPTNPDSSPFATIQPGRQPAITEAVVVAEGSQSESGSGNSAIGHAMELDAATAGRATIGPASPAPTPPARPDAGIPPTPLPIVPESLNLLQKNWGWMLGRQLHWMINNRTHEAKISVNPPHLGPLEVRVSLHQHQTSVTFFSHEAAVREALETAMPRLRELLDGQGLHLNQAQVSDPSLARQQTGWGEQAPRQRDGGSAAENRNQETAADDADDQSPPPRRPRGMVDDYV